MRALERIAYIAIIIALGVGYWGQSSLLDTETELHQNTRESMYKMYEIAKKYETAYKALKGE